jgi:hypothetical protein
LAQWHICAVVIHLATLTRAGSLLKEHVVMNAMLMSLQTSTSQQQYDYHSVLGWSDQIHTSNHCSLYLQPSNHPRDTTSKEPGVPKENPIKKVLQHTGETAPRAKEQGNGENFYW